MPKRPKWLKKKINDFNLAKARKDLSQGKRRAARRVKHFERIARSHLPRFTYTAKKYQPQSEWSYPVPDDGKIPFHFYTGDFPRNANILVTPCWGTMYIYALRHPGSRLVKYVGRSWNPELRLEQHLEKASKDVTAWLEGLAEDALTPDLKILEQCTLETWADRERYWIWFFRQHTNILNVTDGGE